MCRETTNISITSKSELRLVLGLPIRSIHYDNRKKKKSIIMALSFFTERVPVIHHLNKTGRLKVMFREK